MTVYEICSGRANMVTSCCHSESHEVKASSIISELHASAHSLALPPSLEMAMATICGSVKNKAEAIAICICLIQKREVFFLFTLKCHNTDSKRTSLRL